MTARLFPHPQAHFHPDLPDACAHCELDELASRAARRRAGLAIAAVGLAIAAVGLALLFVILGFVWILGLSQLP